DLLRGIPLVLADFLEQIHLPDPDLTNAGARPEDAPRLVIAALQKLQTAVSKREEELKAANEKIAELCKYGAKRDEDVQREAYDALRVELLDVSKRCADAEAKLRELGVEETKAAGTSLITKMSMLIYQLQVSVISGTGLRTKAWRPGPEAEALSCILSTTSGVRASKAEPCCEQDSACRVRTRRYRGSGGQGQLVGSCKKDVCAAKVIASDALIQPCAVFGDSFQALHWYIVAMKTHKVAAGTLVPVTVGSQVRDQACAGLQESSVESQRRAADVAQRLASLWMPATKRSCSEVDGGDICYLLHMHVPTGVFCITDLI
ncbi:unnamed protein product, partial [Symbiodinium sp. CCMP2456]